MNRGTPLTLSLSPWERERSSQRARRDLIQASLPRPHPLADADTLSCKLAKASLRGEGGGEGQIPSVHRAMRCPHSPV